MKLVVFHIPVRKNLEMVLGMGIAITSLALSFIQGHDRIRPTSIVGCFSLFRYRQKWFLRILILFTNSFHTKWLEPLPTTGNRWNESTFRTITVPELYNRISSCLPVQKHIKGLCDLWIMTSTPFVCRPPVYSYVCGAPNEISVRTDCGFLYGQEPIAWKHWICAGYVCWYRAVPQQGPDVLSADCPAVYVNFYIT